MFKFVSILSAGLLIAGSAGATILFDNLTAPPGPGSPDPVNASEWNAQKFFSDSSSDTLLSVTLNIDQVTAGNLFVDIYNSTSNSNSGLPNAVVGTLTNPASIGTSLSNETFTTSGIVLAPNTAYWAVMGVSSGPGAYNESWTDSTTGTGAGYSPIYTVSLNPPGNWQAGLLGADEPYLMEVQIAGATGVPEPGTFGIAACALAALGLWRRNRRSPGSYIG